MAALLDTDVEALVAGIIDTVADVLGFQRVGQHAVASAAKLAEAAASSSGGGDDDDDEGPDEGGHGGGDDSDDDGGALSAVQVEVKRMLQWHGAGTPDAATEQVVRELRAVLKIVAGLPIKPHDLPQAFLKPLDQATAAAQSAVYEAMQADAESEGGTIAEREAAALVNAAKAKVTSLPMSKLLSRYAVIAVVASLNHAADPPQLSDAYPSVLSAASEDGSTLEDAAVAAAAGVGLGLEDALASWQQRGHITGEQLVYHLAHSISSNLELTPTQTKVLWLLVMLNKHRCR